MATSEYQISYYDVDERGRVNWNDLMDTELVTGANDALESAKAWMTTDEDRDVRLVLPDPDCAYMYARPKGAQVEDMVAVIEKVKVAS